jgi:hypothetical protein
VETVRINAGTGGAVTLNSSAGSTGGAGLNLTIVNSGTTTVSGAATLNAVQILDTTLSAVFGNNTDITTFTTTGESYDVDFQGAANTFATAVVFRNTGAVTLGNGPAEPGGPPDAFLFKSGVSTNESPGSRPVSTNVFGKVLTSADPLTFGPTNLRGDSVLETTGDASPAGAPIRTESITGNAHTLDLNSGTGGQITVTGLVDGISHLKILQSSGATFQNSLGLTAPGQVTIDDTGDDRTVAFQGDSTRITMLTTKSQQYNVAFQGMSTQIDAAATFLNTGKVVLGNGPGGVGQPTDVILFDGAVTTAGPPGSSPAMTEIFGTVRTSGDELNFGPTVLSGDSTIDTTNNTSTGGAALNVVSIAPTTAGTTHSLDLNSGTVGAMQVSGVVGGVNELEIVQSNGATFAGAFRANLVTISDTVDDKTAAFRGSDTEITRLVTTSEGYNVAFEGERSAITSLTGTSFLNTGLVMLGDNENDIIHFVKGVSTTGTGPASRPSMTNLHGKVRTTDAVIDFGPTALGGDSIIDTTNNTGTGGAALNVMSIGTATAGVKHSVDLNSGVNGLIKVAGTADNIDELTILQSNGATFQGLFGANSVMIEDTENDHAVAFAGEVTSIGTLETKTQGYNVAFEGTLSQIETPTDFINTGIVILGNGPNNDEDPDVLLFNGGVNTSGPAGSRPITTEIFGTVRTSGDQADFGPAMLNGNSVVDTTSGGTLGADIVFTESLIGNPGLAGGEDVAVTAGMGNVKFSGEVGSGTGQELGTLLVTSATITDFGDDVKTNEEINVTTATITLSNSSSLNTTELASKKVRFEATLAGGLPLNSSFEIVTDAGSISEKIFVPGAFSGNGVQLGVDADITRNGDARVQLIIQDIDLPPGGNFEVTINWRDKLINYSKSDAGSNIPDVLEGPKSVTQLERATLYSFSHKYNLNPLGTATTSIPIQLILTAFAAESGTNKIQLIEDDVSVLPLKSELTLEPLVRDDLSPLQQPFVIDLVLTTPPGKSAGAVPLPEPLPTPFVAAPIVETQVELEQQPIVPTQVTVQTSAGVASEETERYYELRVVTFTGEGEPTDRDGVWIKLILSGKDAEDPRAQEIFPFNPGKLRELFSRLPDDRYRLYLIEGEAERLLLDFVIQQGRPVEMQETDPTAPADDVSPSNQLEQPADTLLETGASPAPSETGASNTTGIVPIQTEQYRPPSFAERVGRASFVSHGGVVLTAAVMSGAPRASHQASVDRLLAHFGRRRPNKRPQIAAHASP